MPILVIGIILESIGIYALLLIFTNIVGLSIIRASFKYTNSLAIV